MILIFPVILFLSLCVYFFIFKMNIWHVYGLRFGNKSNIMALYNSSYLFTYFTFPIITNFYNLFMTKENSSFERALGEKKLLIIFGYNIVDFLPVIFLLMIVLTGFNLPNMIISSLSKNFRKFHDNRV